MAKGRIVCGITGWISFRQDLTGQRPVVEAMTATMACRGPDDAGIWLVPHAALGHRRLAVIDVPGGKQPMTAATADGPVTIVYSGECYNFTELRAELRQRGHGFRTDSDTEVVLHGYLEWGDRVLERLNGMYAFALWDQRAERLLLARDRMGIKPLYYRPTGDGVLFGSEEKAILAHPDVRPVIGPDGLREMLTLVKTPGEGIWDGMREVVPGTVVTVDRAGLRSRTYWQLSGTRHTDDIPATVARVRDLLDDIVARQLVSDVPLCVLLSGGLDSSALTALAAGQVSAAGGKLRTFAVDFTGQTENFVPDELRPTPDAPFVADVAAHVGSDHRDIVLDAGTLAAPSARRTVVTARDWPAGLGDMDSSLYLLFAAIRGHSTVALSGESADEVFGGYAWFHDPVIQQADTFPWLAATMGRGMAGTSALDPALERALDLDGYVRHRYAEAVAEVPGVDGVTGRDDTEDRLRRICYLHLTRFVRVLLDRKDRMSMAVGLEVRVPFCDHRLVDYVFNTPWSYKTFDGREKSLLRAAVQDTLPSSVVKRVKSPYPSTQDLGYITALQDQSTAVIRRGHETLGLFREPELIRISRLDPKSVTLAERHAMERLLDFAAWTDLYHPVISL